MSEIKKVLTVFSMFEKMFPKMNGLICTLKIHINWTHNSNIKLWVSPSNDLKTKSTYY